MPAERFLVTGALGCIGAWVVHELLREGVAVTTFDAGEDTFRLRCLLSEEELAAVTRLQGDVADARALRSAVVERGITNVIHLAGLQVPFCAADPPCRTLAELGARLGGDLQVLGHGAGTPRAAVVVCVDHRRQRCQGVRHRRRIGRGGQACLVERPATAATEVDAELFEHFGRSKIIRYELTDRSRG